MSQNNPIAIALKGAPPDLLLDIACKTMSAFNVIADIREEMHLIRKSLESIERKLNGEQGEEIKPPNTITGSVIATCPECKEQTLRLSGTVKIGGTEHEVWRCTNKLCNHAERR